MLLMAEKRISDAIYRYTKANNKHMKNYAKKKESVIWLENVAKASSEQFLVFSRSKILLTLVKKYNVKVINDIFLKLMLILEKFHELHNDLPFYMKE